MDAIVNRMLGTFGKVDILANNGGIPYDGTKPSQCKARKAFEESLITGAQFRLLAKEGLVRPEMLIINVGPNISTLGALGT